MPKLAFEKILLLDIETVPVVKKFEQLSLAHQQEWEKKALRNYADEQLTTAQSFEKYAGIFAEFGKIVCISIGRYVVEKNEVTQFKVRSFSGDDESTLLSDFAKFISQRKDFTYIAGHNIREFDVPYLCRRMLVNSIALPMLLNISGRKPYELDYLLDTLQLWKFGDYKHYTSLQLLCTIMNIATSKTNLDGSKVAATYWQQNDLTAITKYCEQDIVAVAQLLLKFHHQTTIDVNNIEFLS
jgi:3'-5' exonuclease